MQETPVFLPEGYYVYDLATDDGVILLLVEWFDLPRDAYALGILQVDRVTGAVLAQREVTLLDAQYTSGVFARSDAAPVVLTYGYTDGGEPVSEVSGYDAATDTLTAMDATWLGEWPDAAAYSEGVLYAFVSDYVASEDGWVRRISAWDVAAGLPIDIGVGAADLGWELNPAPGGVVSDGRGGLHQFDRATGLWTLLPLSGGLYGGQSLSATERLLWFSLGNGGNLVVYDTVSGELAIAGEPCVPLALSARAAMLDGHPVSIGEPWDVEGDGSIPLYTFTIGSI